MHKYVRSWALYSQWKFCATAIWTQYVTQSRHIIPYSRKLLREETFANFAVLWLFVKVISTKFGAWHPLARHRQAIHESFLCENHIFHQFANVFFLESFPLYGIISIFLEDCHIYNTAYLHSSNPTRNLPESHHIHREMNTSIGRMKR